MKIINLFLVLAFCALSTLLSAQSIEGVWSFKHWEIDSPNNKDSYETQPGLLIVSGNYYSFAYVSGKNKRPLFSEDNPIWEDMEMMQKTFGAYISNSGTFSIEGNKFLTKPTVALYPNFMETGSAEYLMKIDGDKLILITEGENNADKIKITATWTRLQ